MADLRGFAVVVPDTCFSNIRKVGCLFGGLGFRN